MSLSLNRINMAHNILYEEINKEFNPEEDFNRDKFAEFIVNIPSGTEIYVLANIGVWDVNYRTENDS